MHRVLNSTFFYVIKENHTFFFEWKPPCIYYGSLNAELPKVLKFLKKHFEVYLFYKNII